MVEIMAVNADCLPESIMREVKTNKKIGYEIDSIYATDVLDSKHYTIAMKGHYNVAVIKAIDAKGVASINTVFLSRPELRSLLDLAER